MKMLREYRLTKAERLHSSRTIDNLLAEGNVLFHYPFKVFFKTNNEILLPGKVLCSFVIIVPKRNFKRAVQRNLLKRRIREAYRKNKFMIHDALLAHGVSLHFLLRYVSNEELSYAVIEKALREVLGKLAATLTSGVDISIPVAD